MKALFIKTNREGDQEMWVGTLADTEGVDTNTALYRDLKALQTFVGGWVEVVALKNATMYVNEEGLIHGLPRNDLATEIAHRYGRLPKSDHIVGDVVIVGPADPETGHDTDLPESVQSKIYALMEGKVA